MGALAVIAVVFGGCQASPGAVGAASPMPASSTLTSAGRASASASPSATSSTAGIPAVAEPTPSRVSTSSSPSAAQPSFRWVVRRVLATDLGSSWREGCPAGPEALRIVAVSHWTFEGTVATGELVLDAAITARARQAFARLFELRFPIRRMRSVDEYGSRDDRSMAADNTSAFNCRYIANRGRTWSNHAYGRAIDINPVENPYVLGGDAFPPAGARYVDRSSRPGMLLRGGTALAAFTDAGFGWGGSWANPDYQHVEIPR